MDGWLFDVKAVSKIEDSNKQIKLANNKVKITVTEKLARAGPFACLFLFSVWVDKVQSFAPKLLPSILRDPSKWR